MVSACLQVRSPIMFECGPNILKSANPATEIRTLVAKTKQTYNLGVSFLLYTREKKLPHTNLNIGGHYLDPDDVEGFYRSLNIERLPFNLAINGSPDYRLHVPFDSEELDYLKNLQDSGVQAGVKNAVTIADNALVPILRDQFPGLDVIASCISTSFEPNLAAFRDATGISYDDPNFLIEYYKHLYSLYDMVVPMAQLANPAFFSALNINRELLVAKTIVFLSLGCGSSQLGRCIKHYKGIACRVMPNMPVIPDEFISKAEDKHSTERATSCSQSSFSLELMNRFADLRAILDIGIHKFKTPARDGRTEDIFNFLFSFVTQDKSVEAFPERNLISGNSPADIKLSFMGQYPLPVHTVLANYVWPPHDSGSYNGYGYCENTAYTIHNDLHNAALEAWKQIRI